MSVWHRLAETQDVLQQKKREAIFIHFEIIILCILCFAQLHHVACGNVIILSTAAHPKLLLSISLAVTLISTNKEDTETQQAVKYSTHAFERSV